MLTYADLENRELTPMMGQYIEIKKQQPDCLLFFRLGDFYELFFDDAITVSRELELALTARDCGLSEKAPMCGVPHHAADNYLNRLIKKGYKVAICEQLEDPATAKGLVKRGIIQIITPGTLTDDKLLDAKRYSFLGSIYKFDKYYGLAVCDVAGGHFETTELIYGATEAKLKDELARLQPVELVCNHEFTETRLYDQLSSDVLVTVRPEDRFQTDPFQQFFKLDATDANPLHEPLWQKASAGLLSYIEETQQQIPNHLNDISPYQMETYMVLDETARRNLELTETLRDRKRRGSLLWAIDRTKTGMGARLLKSWLGQPLFNIHDIQRRQLAILELKNQFIARQEIMDKLRGIYDLERLAGKLAFGSVNGRDLQALAQVLERIAPLKDLLGSLEDPYLRDLHTQLDPLAPLVDLLDRSLVDDPPISVTDGGLIKQGFDPRVDELSKAATDGKQWILDLEQREREKTQIKSLKVKYNRLYGYFIEVTKANLDLVPDHYIRRQTLVNNERFITEELKQLEDKILGAQQKLLQLEYDIFCDLRNEAQREISHLKANASALAQLDCLVGLAELADRENYCQPELLSESQIEIIQGRHPVVEQMLKDTSFVANDLILDHENRQVMVLTGPNMSGKSTYMRQTALIVLLAQMGSFVPALSAKIGLVDRIFTRVGAADDVGAGQSTFMVEMHEVAQIMRQATSRSLLILDEIGRGTSTFDGLAIAWSVIEHIADDNYLGSLTLFATHYHELIDLEKNLSKVFNCHIAVSEKDQDIVFLHQIKEGGTDDSYGIDVAKLAGVPDRIVQRAKELLYQLEHDNQEKRLTLRRSTQPMDGQLDIFAAARELNQTDQLVNKIKELDLNLIRPLDALSILADLQDDAMGKKN